MNPDQAIAANIVDQDFESDVPAWTECAECGEFNCNIHGEHVHDCPCPPLDVWVSHDRSPYEDPFLWRVGHLLPDPGGYAGFDWPEAE